VAALLGLGTLGGLAAWWLMGDREGQAAATGTTPDPLADTPPEPTAPVPDRGVAELLRQGAADLDGGHAGTARALFSSAAERPEATPGQVRRALLGRARAQARLGFWELARKDLARLDGVAGPPLDGADLANRQALDVLTAPPGPDLLGPLAGLRGGPALEAMAAWERAEVLQRGRLVVGQALDRVSATADPKAALALTRAILKYQPDEPAALAELPPLEALELAADGARKAPAADALIRLLTGHPPPPRLAALFQALVGLAEKDPALLAKAVPALDQARPLLPAGQDALLDRHDQLRQQLAGMGTPGPGSILAAAEKAWQAGQPAQARNRLGQVQAGQLSGAERGRYDRLAEALALQEGLQSRDRAARAAAVRQFPEVIARGGAGRPLILFQALADLARDEDAYLEEAVALLEHGLGPRGPLPLEDQKVVGERLAELLARLVAARVPKFDRSTDWGAWLERCARARRTGWVLGCRAEALLEKQRGPVPPEVLAQARKLAFDPAVAEETGAYGAYLRARVEQAAGRPREAVAEVLTIDPVSDLLRAAFRRGQLAEVLLAFVPSDLRAAHVALAGLPAAGVTWNAPAVKNATALLQTAREELTRLQAFDPDQARVLLNSAEVKALADRLAPVLDQWADRGVETGARKGGKVPDGAAALGLARECGELLIILGRTIPGAQWVGKACDLLEDPDAALRGLEAGLPPGLALDQLTPAHLPLLFQRHYLIVTHGAHFAPRIPAPQGVLGPAEAAVPLADRALAEARRAAEQGGPKDKAAAERARQATNQLAEARGVAGWANRHVIMLQPNNPGPGQIRKWRLAALGHFREALALAPGHPFAGSWRLLFAEQVAALRDGEAQDQAAADQNRAEALRYVGEALRAANLSAEDRARLELFRNQLQK
jgi:hypothetical protein